MVRYRVSYKIQNFFGIEWQETKIVESTKPISTKEIANILNINTGEIIHIEIA